MSSWLTIDPDSGFSLQNLPYCVYSIGTSGPRIGVAIGEHIVNMGELLDTGIFSDIQYDLSSLKLGALNEYASLPKHVHSSIRSMLQELFKADTSQGHILRDDLARREKILDSQRDAEYHLPMNIGDYTDFFVTYYHASTCQKLFLSGGDLNPNYLSQPIAYHGRASSVVVSGTPIHRPNGQFKTDQSVLFGPCTKLDYEVEFAAFIGQGNAMGTRIDVDKAEDHIFGVVLMNDWSARDIQRWESTPLGPFNGKNFGTTISPFVVPLEALEPWRVAPLQPRAQLAYLDQKRKDSVYNIPINVSIEDSQGRLWISTCNTSYVAFSFAQMLAHHTAGGCPMKPGDLIATGTLSGPKQEQAACLLEMTRDGTEPLKDSDGKQSCRTWLEDGDTVTYAARASGKSGFGNVGFGECSGTIVASA